MPTARERGKHLAEAQVVSAASTSGRVREPEHRTSGVGVTVGPSDVGDVEGSGGSPTGEGVVFEHHGDGGVEVITDK